MYQYRMFRNFRTVRFAIAGVIVAISASSVFAQQLAPPAMQKKPVKPAEGAPQVVRFETSDGVKIEADYYPAAVKEGEKAPAAILIHMYPADRTSWKPLAPGLHKAGFAVLAYDIRGHGGSTEPADKKLKEAYDKRDSKLFADAWKDVEAAKKWLAEQPGCDVKRMALVGASIGCSISIDYAGRDEAVKAVVCLSPGTKYMGVDSIAHIKKCGKRAILLISPEGEYKAVEELIKASGGKAKGEKHPGGEKEHGTGMFKADYGKTVRENIVAFVSKAIGMKEPKKAGKDESKPGAGKKTEEKPGEKKGGKPTPKPKGI
jgi:dienelactone hydrolase